MSKKLFFLTSFVLVLALAGTNAAFGGFIVEVRVADGNDDAEETVVGGGMSRGSSDLELGHESVASPENLQIVGVRFTGVGIPKGVAIRKAWVQFTADDVDNEQHFPPVSLIVEGELSPNPVDFGTGDISSRATTTASAVWDVSQWGSFQAKGPAQRSSDISHIIQEIIDQDGWAAGNAMVVIFRDNPDNPSEGTREAEAFDDDYSRAPLLHIEYAVKYATDPNPADGSTGEPAPLMQWTSGYTAVFHDVYLGTNPDLGPDDYMDRMPFAKYWHVPGFTLGTTYYWRIDEVEADGTTIYTGNVWSFFAAPLTAHSPNPPDGNKTALPNTVLSWGSGVSAASHDVYFGTSRADVAAGTGDTFKGNQMDDTYNLRGLENGTIHYWRIDEVEADGTTKHQGEVWSFKTFDDPALIGWWKFDEGQGNIAYDSSGYGNHAIIGGEEGPLWTLGAIDGGLGLGDGNYVDIDSIVPEMTSVSFTVSIWIKSEMTSGEGVLFGSNTDSSHEFLFGINNGNPWKDDGIKTEFPPSVANNQWHMLTYVMEGKTSLMYIDGVLRKEDLSDTEVSSETRWSIGSEWDSGPSDEYEGLVDDARFWIRSLTAEEIAEVFKGDVDLAHSPMPANHSTPGIGQVPPLSWSPGENATQHDVYFSTDELAVQGTDASDTTGIYRGRQSATSYTPPEPLEWGTGPYYWRIDEYNTEATISKGKVWNFTVADFLLVDDFEDYNDYPPDEIWSTWTDGYGTTTNGSTVGYPEPDWSAGEHYVETTIVHGGAQSMPYFYDNDFKYSEASRTLVSVRDWTKEGVAVLSLWFRGDASNAAELMYVALDGSAVVNHDNPNAAQIGAWTEWTIDLQEFAAQGVNLANVNTITIGFGDKNNLQAGGSGLVFFDDIRLYRPAP